MTDLESTPPSNLTDQKTTPRNNKSFSALIIANLAILIAILSFLSQLFFWQLHKKNNDNLAAVIQSLENKSTSNQKTILQIQENIKQLQISHAETNPENFINSLLIREAEYLVTMAYYSLIFETNTDIAISLLETADTKLRQSSDVALLEIRKALANNIIELKLIPKLDVPGLILRINALSDQINQLAQQKVAVVAEKQQATPASTQKNTWRQKLAAVMNQLTDVISIRRLKQPVKPLLSEDQQFYLVENIRLQLSQAQWAALHRDQSLYLQGLQRAEQLIQQYFSSSAQASNVLQVIAELKNINLKPAFPNLTKTMELIQTAERNVQQKNVQVTSKPNSSSINIPPGNLPQTNPAQINPPANPNMNNNIPNPIPRAMPS